MAEVIASCRIKIEKSLLFFRVFATRGTWESKVGALLRAVWRWRRLTCTHSNQTIMKRKSTSQFAFFNIRVLIGLFIVLVGTFIALAGFGLFTSFAANAAPAKHSAAKQYNAYNSSVDISLLPPGFDCSRIHELGYDKMENFRAGLILKGCGAGEEDSASSAHAASRLVQSLLPTSPLFIGGA